MKTLLTITAFFSFTTLFAQAESEKVDRDFSISIAAADVYLPNISSELPNLHVTKVGTTFGTHGFGVEVAYLKNHTLDRHGLTFSANYFVWKKKLPKAKAGIGSQIAFNAAILYGDKNINFQTVSLGFGFKKKIVGDLYLKAFVAAAPKRLQIEGLDARYTLEFPIGASIIYEF